MADVHVTYLFGYWEILLCSMVFFIPHALVVLVPLKFSGPFDKGAHAFRGASVHSVPQQHVMNRHHSFVHRIDVCLRKSSREQFTASQVGCLTRMCPHLVAATHSFLHHNSDCFMKVFLALIC